MLLVESFEFEVGRAVADELVAVAVVVAAGGVVVAVAQFLLRLKLVGAFFEVPAALALVSFE